MAGPHEGDPLVLNSPFNYRNRQPRDVFWGVLYLLFLALTVVGGIIGIVNMNPNFARAFEQDYMADARHCPVHTKSLGDAKPEVINLPQFFRQAAVWLVVSAVASVLLGVAFLQLFKHQPHAMTHATIFSQIAAPAALGLAALFAGQIGGAVTMLVLAGLAALTFFLWRNEIELCARLLGIAAAGLHDNPGLIAFTVVAKIVMTLLVLPCFAFMFMAYTNGRITPNEQRVDSQQQGHQCYDGQGNQVPCCAWEPAPWVPPYMSLASVTLLWTVFLCGQVRKYVISATIAQWYFAPPGQPDALKGSTLRSVRYALGPSFGTCALGAAVLTAIEIMRNAMQQAEERRRNQGENILWSLLACCLQCVWALIEFLTKFATVRAAITGEAFFEAARNVTDLLRRNFLKAFGVWWFPPLVLQTAALALSFCLGVLVYAISFFAWHGRENAQAQAVLLGGLSFFMAWIVQAFFAAVLLDIVDAVFICYAMDKDMHSVTKPQVHEVFAEVPVGVAVEQPGGEYSYGAPVQGGYVPPSHPAAGAPGGTPPPAYGRQHGYYDSQSAV